MPRVEAGEERGSATELVTAFIMTEFTASLPSESSITLGRRLTLRVSPDSWCVKADGEELAGDASLLSNIKFSKSLSGKSNGTKGSLLRSLSSEIDSPNESS